MCAWVSVCVLSTFVSWIHITHERFLLHHGGIYRSLFFFLFFAFFLRAFISSVWFNDRKISAVAFMCESFGANFNHQLPSKLTPSGNIECMCCFVLSSFRQWQNEIVNMHEIIAFFCKTTKLYHFIIAIYTHTHTHSIVIYVYIHHDFHKTIRNQFRS